MRIPSIKFMTDRGFTLEQATFLREKMEKYHDNPKNWGKWPRNTMTAMSDFLQMDGVETIPAGTNQRSPEIMYINSGDTYHTTVLFYNDSFHIGDWGTIVERGNYP